MANPLYGQNKADSRLAYQPKIVKVPLVAIASHAAGDHFAWANPEGGDILVESFTVQVTTEATGAATCDYGIAADGTTGSDTLLDGIDIGTAAISGSQGDSGGTNGVANQVMSSSEWITGDASADSSGVVGFAYIKYVVLSDVA